ncbi:hypothetical protein GCM10009839_02880 [Catenulispora yoronensis]|uniref:Peptidase A4 family protein n=1 Tax=Catenulispora yoronensis TaxID=450799 RepID=A0ABP5EYR1_9ACTN
MRTSSTAGPRRRGPRLAEAVAAAALAVPAGAAPVSAGAAGAGRALGYAPVSGQLADSVWGGYVATGSGFRSIVGSWIEPTVSCTSSSNLFAPWVGIDGYGSSTVEQVGAEVSCASGSPRYRAWYEMYPANPVYLATATHPVHAGDSFTGTVTTAGNGSYTLTLKDNTQGWSYRTTKQLGAQNVSAEAIIESPSHSYPRFSSCSFSGITVNGRVLDSYNPIGLSSGGYRPTALSNGSFAMVP